MSDLNPRPAHVHSLLITGNATFAPNGTHRLAGGHLRLHRRTRRLAYVLRCPRRFRPGLPARPAAAAALWLRRSSGAVVGRNAHRQVVGVGRAHVYPSTHTVGATAPSTKSTATAESTAETAWPASSGVRLHLVHRVSDVGGGSSLQVSRDVGCRVGLQAARRRRLLGRQGRPEFLRLASDR